MYGRSNNPFFRALIEEDPDLIWSKLKYALLERYGRIGEGIVFEQLAVIRQNGTLKII
jgi:hypothetical protein